MLGDGFDFLKFPKLSKISYFRIRLGVYRIRVITTLTVVDSGSPRLRINKSG